MINVKSNIKTYVKKEISTLKGDVTKAHVRTVNEVARGAFSETRREIRTRINIKDKDLKEGSRITKANFKHPKASIISRSRRRGLSLTKYYGGKMSGGKKNKQATFMVIKGRRTTLPGGFEAVMSSGHRGLFTRKGKSRLPIDEKYGPNQAQLIGSRKSMNTIDRYVRENYAKKYKNNLSYYRSRN